MTSQGIQRKRESGFTLTELMVSLVISGVLMTSVYAVFNSQQKSYAVQDQLAASHQNLRAAMNFMVKEIRMAGFDPLKDPTAGINRAEANKIVFTMRPDSNNDGKVDENDTLKEITYSLYDSGMDVDLTKDDLGRKIGAGSNQPVAQNIDTLDFVYLDDEGKPLEFPIANLRDIRAVQITLVAKTAKPDPNFKQNGGFRTKTLTERVVCRNLAF
jgi:type IV pilus assembly protein PilW